MAVSTSVPASAAHEVLGGAVLQRPRGSCAGILVLAVIAPALSNFALPAHATTGVVTPDGAALLEAEALTTEILSLDGDAAFGEYLGGACVTCHQTSSHSNGIPAIVGLPTDYTVQALVEYKLGLRENPVMRLMTERLSNEEIAALAEWLGTMDVD